MGGSLIGTLEGHHDRAIIAHLARLVDAEARSGDGIARRIMETAASELSQSVFDACDSLGMLDQNYCLVGTGGVIERSDIYWEHLCRCGRDFAPNMRTVRTDLPHVVGTVLFVLGKLSIGDACAAKERLLDRARAMFGPLCGGNDNSKQSPAWILRVPAARVAPALEMERGPARHTAGCMRAVSGKGFPETTAK